MESKQQTQDSHLVACGTRPAWMLRPGDYVTHPVWGQQRLVHKVYRAELDGAPQVQLVQRVDAGQRFSAPLPDTTEVEVHRRVPALTARELRQRLEFGSFSHRVVLDVGTPEDPERTLRMRVDRVTLSDSTTWVELHGVRLRQDGRVYRQDLTTKGGHVRTVRLVDVLEVQ